jgi:hypothetical protein
MNAYVSEVNKSRTYELSLDVRASSRGNQPLINLNSDTSADPQSMNLLEAAGAVYEL